MAQLAELNPRLQQALLAQAISLAEAWAFQDLILLAPHNSVVPTPQELQPMLERMWLLEVLPDNRLPA